MFTCARGDPSPPLRSGSSQIHWRETETDQGLDENHVEALICFCLCARGDLNPHALADTGT
jgi:hypothetical protein